MSLLQTERMRQDMKKQQQTMLLTCLSHLEQRYLATYLTRWRKWTRTQMVREFEKLQRSMTEFDRV